MRKKVLIIDDNRDMLEVMSTILQTEGYAVDTIERGEYVPKIKKYIQYRPDVIIIDTFLAGTDGRTLTKKLKSEKQTATIPIIMTSAMPNIKKSAQQSGADDFLSKPFDTEDLVNIVNQYSE